MSVHEKEVMKLTKLITLPRSLFARTLTVLCAGSFLSAIVPAAAQTQCPETNGTKYVQLPNLMGGSDVWDNGPWMLADDFICTNSGPITDIHLWGSWLNDLPNTNLLFYLAIYDDVPANPPNPSHPGNLQWQETFYPGQYVQAYWSPAGESFLDPGPPAVMGFDSNAWYYCFYPTNAFVQQSSNAQPKIYWLMVYAQPLGTNTQPYGWKTTTSVLFDTSVHAPWPGMVPTNYSGWVPTTSPTGLPLDLAFKITTATNVPPPEGCVETNGVKYVQWPNLFGGLDVWDNGPWVLADDFICTNSGPISDIHLWGSWFTNGVGTNLTFWLAIYSDVPVNPTNSFSHPGNLLWQQQFAPSQYSQSFWGSAQELFLDPGPPQILGPDFVVWYYCFYPTNAFQTGSSAAPTTYWLVVYAQSPAAEPFLYGWKTTTNVQHDVSVFAPWTGVPPPNPWPWNPTHDSVGLPLDLAFKITTVTNVPPPEGCVETNGVKYIQPPNLNGGFDVWDNGPWVLADDFLCTNSGPVSDIHIWGSWLNDQMDTNMIFYLAIYDDVPASPTNSSHPGNLQWQETFFPGQFVQVYWSPASESFLDPGPPAPMGFDSNAWYYCFYPTNAFLQQGDSAQPKIYWLMVYAQPMGTNIQAFGWKSTLGVHFDPSVHTVWPGTPPVGNPLWMPTQQYPGGPPLDLAFKITTATNLPPPQTCVETNATKYVQWPNLQNGLDVWDSGPWVLADDFICTNTGPVSDIHLWGSWLTNAVSTNLTFWLAIYDDVPASPTNSSHPGNLQWLEQFVPGQYVQSFWSPSDEVFLDPETAQIIGPDTQAWYLCFYPTTLFVQQGSSAAPKTYWLMVYAQPPTGTNIYYGWKTTTNVQHDVSVFAPWPGGPPPNPWTWNPTHDSVGKPLDLAFKITTDTNLCKTTVVCSTNKTVECGFPWLFDPPLIIPNPCCTNPPTVNFIALTNVLGPCQEIVSGLWVIQDCFGATYTCTQVVTVVDTTAPVITCASNKTVECGTAWSFDTPTAIDACSGTNVGISVVSTVTNSGPCPLVIVRTWQAMDYCSNSAFCSQTVSVADTTPPSIVCPSNIVVKTCGTNSIVVTWSLSATDACSSVTITSTPPSGTAFAPNTTNTVVATATDACGNTNSCAFTVSVVRPVLKPIAIRYIHTNVVVVLDWTDGILQSATNVMGPYVDVTGATPPFTNTATLPMKFFRLRCSSP